MMKKVITVLACLFFAAGTSIVNAQQDKPFAGEIQAFIAGDSTNPPKAHPIVFTGSSSIRMWENLQESFPGYNVINRGFGGSTLAQLDMYLDKIVFPYKPKQVVIYSGENDIATDTASAQEVFRRFKAVYQKLRAKLPTVPVEYISIKPSPSRRKFFPVVIEANKLISEFISKQKNVRYIDVFSKMLDERGEPMPGIYLEDDLHMNARGYAIWTSILQPYLVK